MWEVFKTAYFACLGVLAAAATGLTLWGLYDVAVGVIASIRSVYQLRRRSGRVAERLRKEAEKGKDPLP